METAPFEAADPFWGNSESSLPPPKGLAEKWYKLKAQTGNTHPGPCLPFGMVSAVPYSGAYPTGYGVYGPNSYGHPDVYLPEKCCKGFTHFQVSGTGAILKYYQFSRVVPLGAQGMAGLDTLYPLREERAVPGAYEALLGDSGIRAALAAGPKGMWHRYAFDHGEPAVAVDLLQCGLAMKDHDPSRILEASVTPRGPGCYDAYILYDLPLYACIRFSDPEAQCQLLLDGQPRSAAVLPDAFGHTLRLLCRGVLGRPLNVQLAFSLRSAQQAYENLLAEPPSLEEARRRAALAWQSCLGAIQTRTQDQQLRGIFYSALYHSCVKPANFRGESPFWQLRPDCYLDFATLWDQYKTQLPLVFTLYPEAASGMVNALINFGECQGEFPNTILMSPASSLESQQALSLAVYAIVDAYWRGTPGVDWDRALRVMDQDLTAKARRMPRVGRITHYLDYGEACLSAAAMAEDLGRSTLAERFRGFSRWEAAAYDPVTGLLRDGEYYEGHVKTYSFRLMHRMGERMARYPSREALLADLDAFFGFTSGPAPQDFDGLSGSENEWRANHYQRFEALNNEPDMETPFFYVYLNQHHKTARILHDVFRYMFAPGPGGLPGNNDSGGLSSWYVWNAMGLFPVTGQNLMLLGTPALESCELHLANGRVFRVETQGHGGQRIYIRRALLDGRPLPRRWLTVREFMAGGTLTLEMSDQEQPAEALQLPPGA